MSLVNAEIKMQGNNDAFFTTNAAVVYPANIQIFHIDGRYKFTDGVTNLATLPFRGAGGGSATELISPDGNTSVQVFDNQARMDSTDGVDTSSVIVEPNNIQLISDSVTKNGETIETQNNKGQANGYVELDAFNRYLFPAQANPTVKSVIRNINTTPRNYIFPDATGTVALTSDIPSVTGLVPYTGATTDVDLDTYSLNAKSLHVKGTGGSGHLGLKHQSANITASTSESSLGANASGNPVWKNDGNPIDSLELQSNKQTDLTASATKYPTVNAVISGLANKVGVIVKDITTGSALTGTTAITLIKSVLIPANTFTTGDICQIINRAIRSTATGTSNNYIYINTSASLSGATLVGTQGGAVRFYGMERNLYIKSATVSETSDTASSASGDNPAVFAQSNSDLNINWTVDQYIIHAFSNQAVGNSTVSSGLIVTKI